MPIDRLGDVVRQFEEMDLPGPLNDELLIDDGDDISFLPSLPLSEDTGVNTFGFTSP